MDASFYRMVIGQWRGNGQVPHIAIPSHNLTSLPNLAACSQSSKTNVDDITVMSDENEANFLSEFPCYNQFGYDVGMSSVLHCGTCSNDIMLSFLDQKLLWKKREKFLRPTCVLKGLKTLKQLKKSRKKKKNEIPLRLLLYMKHIESEPSPTFSGSYNWLYSGGNIGTCTLGDQLLVVSADGANQSCLNMLKLDVDKSDVTDKMSHALKTNQPVLQVEVVNQDTNVLVCARQKNNLSLWNVTDTLLVNKLWKKKVDRDKLMTSCALKGTQCAGLANCAGNVYLFDVETSRQTCKFTMDLSSQEDAFGQIMFVDNIMYFADRNGIHGFDVRSSILKPELSYLASVISEPCEVVCNAWTSERDPLGVYLALTHHVLHVDLRSLNHTQRWTHHMKEPPQFGHSLHGVEQELVALQSRCPEEVIALTSDAIGGGGVHVSRCMPRVVPGVPDTLRSVQYRDSCLNPRTSSRLKSSVTGLRLVQGRNGDDVHLMTANGVGDVFIAKWTPRSRSVENPAGTEAQLERVVSSFAEYEDQCKKMLTAKRFPLKFTRIVDMTPMLNNLQNSSLIARKYRTPEMEWRLREIYSVPSLRLSKDALARRILPVWGVKMEDEEDPDEEEVMKQQHRRLEETDNSDKVRDWLRAH